MLVGVLAIAHFMIGGCVGYFFRVTILIPVALVSCALIIAYCLLTNDEVWVMLIACEVSLQLGYVAGSSLATFLRETSDSENHDRPLKL